MNNKDYKYEVAFSFLKEDEAIAYDINDHIQDRLSTFIYSKKQEVLGGSDGEKKFNEVFNKECRVVVVLYRDGWGQTPWTRIEETAIKNRAYENSWEFLLLVNLDVKSNLPTWIPKTYIWLDYERFKTEGAIAVIEQKVKENNGTLRIETIEDRVERLKRLRNAEKKRTDYLNSREAILAAKQEVSSIIERLKGIKTSIEDPNTGFYLGTFDRSSNPPMYEFGFHNYYLCFNNSSAFDQGIEYGELRVTLYEKEGHHGINYQEKIINQVRLKFDQDLIGNNGWSEIETSKSFLTSEQLVDKWVKAFISGIEKRKI